MNLVLASTSPYRKRLLERLRIPFTCEAPGVDEEAAKRGGLPPRELAERLALAKAAAVAARFADAIVIGSDQLAAVDGAVLGKPGTAEEASAQLARLAGRPHELITAVAMRLGKREWRHTDVTRLHVRTLTPEAIRRYVAADNPLDCAGSYRIESLGIALFDRIETDDATAIEGLPLLAVCRGLRELGCALP